MVRRRGQTQGSPLLRRLIPGSTLPPMNATARNLAVTPLICGVVTDLNHRRDVTGLLSSHSTTSNDRCSIDVTRRGTLSVSRIGYQIPS